MRLAGDKLAAKRIAREAGVPTVPFGASDDVGFPLILKAAAGGGGRGMRIVRDPAELDAEVEAANREARAAFGDGALFAERLVEHARHVEVQLLGDRLGNLTVLGTRDCSIQRRHQKVFEEAPAPGIEAIGPSLDEAALAIGRAAGYESAGTAEFLVSGNEFWFMELNARIQVEHPITEAVTGIDLVAEQLRIANGESIGPAPTEDGHSLEARLYAEHPTTFLPQAGRVERLELPAWIRVDAGVEAGDEIPVGYDPLIAKLVVHAETRTEAFDEMASALAETRVGGVTTNLALLRWIVAHPVVRAGAVSTSFLEEYPPLSRPTDPVRPWSDGWRLNGPAAQRRPPPRLAPSGARSAGGRRSTEIRAPMPGRVIQIVVAEGDRVEARQSDGPSRGHEDGDADLGSTRRRSLPDRRRDRRSRGSRRSPRGGGRVHLIAVDAASVGRFRCNVPSCWRVHLEQGGHHGRRARERDRGAGRRGSPPAKEGERGAGGRGRR